MHIPQPEDIESTVSTPTTARDIAGNGVELPPAPKNSAEKDFECPYCFVIFPSGNSSKSRRWRLYLLQDLWPYSCTYLNCTEADQLFSSQHEWLTHKRLSHWRHWQCLEHPEDRYSLEVDFQAHVQEHHMGATAEQLLGESNIADNGFQSYGPDSSESELIFDKEPVIGSPPKAALSHQPAVKPPHIVKFADNPDGASVNRRLIRVVHDNDWDSLDVLFVRNKGQEHALRLPPFRISESKLLLGELRKKVAQELSEDPEKIQLFYKYDLLIDDSKPCREMGLKQHSTLECIIDTVAGTEILVKSSKSTDKTEP
ncbi:MAG: hypothetical protein MMC33_000534 [Icmadophila ericetorum]|nr:hypothetical protein [Icmadophila ericetorum]